MAFSCPNVTQLVITPRPIQLNGALHILMAHPPMQFLRRHHNVLQSFIGANGTQLKCDQDKNTSSLLTKNLARGS